MRGEEYARFSRIVFDTAPTGHTLRLLTVPDFVEAALGKLIRLRKKLTAAGDAVRGIFGVSNQDVAIQKLEALRVSQPQVPVHASTDKIALGACKDGVQTNSETII